jgi:hypothetical protein
MKTMEDLMKLRIKGDSFRLRVSRSELDRLLRGEQIEETIHFAPQPDAHLTYALARAADGDATGVRYSPGQVTVVLAPGDLNAWQNSGQVGIYTSVNVGPATSLELIIEKDYACLDRGGEDNADSFENPHAGALC